LLATRSGVLAIPAPAVQRGPQGTFVYIVAPDQTAALRTIEVDTIQDQWAVLKRGLNPGEQVVVEGQNQLRPGAKVAKRSSVGGQAGSTDAPGSTGEAAGDAPTGAAAKGKRGGAKP
jgi:multidrug efflux system membrane fusion protein